MMAYPVDNKHCTEEVHISMYTTLSCKMCPTHSLTYLACGGGVRASPIIHVSRQVGRQVGSASFSVSLFCLIKNLYHPCMLYSFYQISSFSVVLLHHTVMIKYHEIGHIITREPDVYLLFCTSSFACNTSCQRDMMPPLGGRPQPTTY